jgi:hypothetical protein
MPKRWRRKYSALFDNVLECGLSDAQLATIVRLQAILHRAWRTDSERYASWQGGDADKILSEPELFEATGVRSLAKSRRKILTLNGCNPYGTGTISIEVNPAADPVQSGARSGAQSVRAIWRNFGQIMNAHGPRVPRWEGTRRPYEGRRTKNEAPSTFVPGQKPSDGWNVPSGAPQLSNLSDEQRQELRKQSAAERERIRRRREQPAG